MNKNNFNFITVKGKEYMTHVSLLGNKYSVHFTDKLRLDFGASGHHSLSEKIEYIISLQVLTLIGYGLVSLPASLGTLKNLSELVIKNTSISSLPETIGNLKRLRELQIIGSNLKSLPTSFGNLNLHHCYLISSKLTSIPSTIGNMKELRNLGLSHNQLTSIPDSIGNLKKLMYLNLSHNKLTTLPDTIRNLENLEHLDLNHNLLTSLPESIVTLKKLVSIDLNGNVLKDIPYFLEKVRVLRIDYDKKFFYSGRSFLQYLIPRHVTINTELINSSISNTNRISNIPPKKRVYINKPSEYNGFKLRRLYNANGLHRALEGRNSIRLHGNLFTKYDIRQFNNMIVNKNVYLRNLKSRLLNNISLSLNVIKKNLPKNVNASDVNTIVRTMKPQLLQKIINKLRTSPSNTRMRLINNFKTRGLINKSDVDVLKKNFDSK